MDICIWMGVLILLQNSMIKAYKIHESFNKKEKGKSGGMKVSIYGGSY